MGHTWYIEALSLSKRLWTRFCTDNWYLAHRKYSTSFDLSHTRHLNNKALNTIHTSNYTHRWFCVNVCSVVLCRYNRVMVCLRLSVATFTQKRRDASFDLWPASLLKFDQPHPVLIMLLLSRPDSSHYMFLLIIKTGGCLQHDYVVK